MVRVCRTSFQPAKYIRAHSLSRLSQGCDLQIGVVIIENDCYFPLAVFSVLSASLSTYLTSSAKCLLRYKGFLLKETLYSSSTNNNLAPCPTSRPHVVIPLCTALLCDLTRLIQILLNTFQPTHSTDDISICCVLAKRKPGYLAVVVQSFVAQVGSSKCCPRQSSYHWRLYRVFLLVSNRHESLSYWT